MSTGDIRWVGAAVAAAAAAALAVVYGANPRRDEGADDEGDADAELRAELSALRLKALRQRALDLGVPAVDVDRALEADRPKAELVDLLLAHAAAEGRAPVVVALPVALQVALENAIGELEQLAAAAPRKSRKALRSLVDRGEELLDGVVEGKTCAALARCEPRDLRALSEALEAVRRAGSSADATNELPAIEGLFGSLERCATAVAQPPAADAFVAAAASSASSSAEPHEPGDPGDAAELTVELRELKLMALHKRALSTGVTSELVEDAMESANPKASLIVLIVDVESRRGPGSDLVQELQHLRPSALSKRALSMGIASTSVDEAMDAD
eukprot:COSAG06_NODE_2059_length_7689_cov_3.076539_5_plen_329_part_01